MKYTEKGIEIVNNAFISEHGADWCHVCGKRVSSCFDIFYPDNAEHPRKNMPEEYLRICSDCIDKIKVIKDAIIEDLKKERKRK